MLEWIVAIAATAIAGILVWTVVSIVSARRRALELRADLERSRALGAQPASLHPRVNLDVCIGSGACIDACPEDNVIAIIDGQARLANPTACIGHGECLRACPVRAIELVIGSEKRGVDIPLLAADYETNVPGLFIVGELGGMGLIYNAMAQALQCMRRIAANPPPRQPGIHQVLIVGAGPAGLAATVAARKAELDYVTLDQESMGGTVLQYPRHKIVMTRAIELPLYGRLKLSSVQKEDLLALWHDIVAQTGVSIRERQRVQTVTRGADGVFDVVTSEGTLRTQRVVLAMGRRGSPRKLDIPGEDSAKVTYRLLEPENYRDKRCLVVGGGDAGVEAAIALAEAGASVHLAHRGQVFDRIKAKNQGRLDEALAASRLEVLYSTRPLTIGADSVQIEVAGAARELPNDYVLVFAGGVLPTAFLEAAGVKITTFRGEVFAPAN